MKNKTTKTGLPALAAAFAAALLSGCAMTEIRPLPDSFPPDPKPAPVKPKPERRADRPSPMPMPAPAPAPAR